MEKFDKTEATSRLRRLIGDEGLVKLEGAHVAVFGLGGVGSACAEALVRGGIGKFTFVDRDCVEPSNLNRQALAFISTLGMRKVDAMRQMALNINPSAQIHTIDAFVNAESIKGVMQETKQGFGNSPDYIVDALDTLSVKALLIEYAQSRDIPIISAMGGANKLDPTQFRFAKLSETSICPLCREMRKISRDRSLADVDVLFSPERPQKVAPAQGAQRLEKTELGTMSYIPPVMGQMIAGFVIQKLLGNLI